MKLHTTMRRKRNIRETCDCGSELGKGYMYKRSSTTILEMLRLKNRTTQRTLLPYCWITVTGLVKKGVGGFYLLSVFLQQSQN